MGDRRDLVKVGPAGYSPLTSSVSDNDAASEGGSLEVALEDELRQVVKHDAAFEGDAGTGEGAHCRSAVVFGQALGEVAAVPALKDVEDLVDVRAVDLVLAVDVAQSFAVGAYG